MLYRNDISAITIFKCFQPRITADGDFHKHQIKVTGLNHTISRDDLKEHFSKFGELKRVKKMYELGFIAFANVSSVESAVEEANHEVHYRLFI